MAGRSNAFHRHMESPRTVSISRNASNSTTSTGAVPQRYNATLGCFVDAPQQQVSQTSEGLSGRLGGPNQPLRGVRYMVKGHAPPASQVARRQAGSVLERGVGLTSSQRRPPRPPLPLPQQQAAPAAAAGQLVLRKAAGGQLVLSVGGAGDRGEELVLQVPENAAGEQLVLQDGAGGEVVLQMPDDAVDGQELVLQDDSGGEVVLQGGQGGQVVLQDPQTGGVVLQDSRGAEVLLQGGAGDASSAAAGAAAGDGGETMVLQMAAGDATERLVLQQAAERHQSMVLDGGATVGEEVVLQVPEGSAGQELVLEQEDGGQVVLQVPHGAAGPDGVIRLIQVTAQDGSIQYITNPADDSEFSLEEAATDQQADQFSVASEPSVQLSADPGSGSGAGLADQESAAQPSPEEAAGAATSPAKQPSVTSSVPSGVTLAESAGKEVGGGGGGSGARPVLPGPEEDGRPAAPLSSALPADTSDSDQTGSSRAGPGKTASSGRAPAGDGGADPAGGDPLAVIDSEPGAGLVTKEEANPEPPAVRTAPEPRRPQPGTGAAAGLRRALTAPPPGSVEEAMERLMGDPQEEEEQVTPPTAAPGKSATSADTAPAADSPADPPPPKEPPPADEAPRGDEPKTIPARAAAAGGETDVAVGGDDGDSSPSVCAVCGQAPRSAPLSVLHSALVRGTNTPLSAALSDCLGDWDLSLDQKVCVSCTVLAGQGFTPGPLQTSAIEHLVNVWTLRCGETLQEEEDSGAAAAVTVTADPAPTPTRSPVTRPSHNRGRRGRGRGRHRRGRRATGRADGITADRPSTAAGGDGGGDGDGGDAGDDGAAQQTSLQLLETEDGGGKGLDHQRDENGQETDTAPDGRRPSGAGDANREGTDSGPDGGGETVTRPESQPAAAGEGLDQTEEPGEQQQQQQEEEQVVLRIKEESEDEGPVKRTTSGRRSRAPRAWSPDVDLTPRAKSTGDGPGRSGVGRGRKRARDSADAASAAKRAKPKATMIHVSKSSKKSPARPATISRKTAPASPVLMKKGGAASKQQNDKGAEQTGKAKSSVNGKREAANGGAADGGRTDVGAVDRNDIVKDGEGKKHASANGGGTGKLTAGVNNPQDAGKGGETTTNAAKTGEVVEKTSKQSEETAGKVAGDIAERAAANAPTEPGVATLREKTSTTGDGDGSVEKTAMEEERMPDDGGPDGAAAAGEEVSEKSRATEDGQGTEGDEGANSRPEDGAEMKTTRANEPGRKRRPDEPMSGEEEEEGDGEGRQESSAAVQRRKRAATGGQRSGSAGKRQAAAGRGRVRGRHSPAATRTSRRGGRQLRSLR